MANDRQSDFIYTAQMMIDGAISDAEIKGALSGFGYDETKLNAGKTLYSEAVDLINAQKKEYGEQYEATENTNKAWEEADKVYVKTLKVARVAFQNNTKAQTSMMLAGSRKESLPGWLEQAEAFYKNLTGDKALLAEMQKYGYTSDKLNEEYDLVTIVSQKSVIQKKETGEAQEATEKRDKKLKELDKWLADFKAIVKVALDDTPQKLEKLGILALNAPRVKKAAAAATMTTAAATAK